MPMLSAGETIAVTTVEEDIMRTMLGITPHYGRAVVLGPTDLPDTLLGGIAMANSEVGHDVREEFGIHAYAVEPQQADGSPVPELENVALVVVVSNSDPVAFHPQIGNLRTAVTDRTRIVKSEYLAQLASEHDAIVSQARTDLEDALFLIAADADAALDPDFFDGTDDDGTAAPFTD